MPVAVTEHECAGQRLGTAVGVGVLKRQGAVRANHEGHGACDRRRTSHAGQHHRPATELQRRDELDRKGDGFDRMVLSTVVVGARHPLFADKGGVRRSRIDLEIVHAVGLIGLRHRCQAGITGHRAVASPPGGGGGRVKGASD